MRNILLSVFLILIIGISSCTKLLEDDFAEFNDDWVINNIMIAGDSIEVEITKTTSVNGEGNPPVEDALIQLMVENETFELSYDENSATYKLNQQIETAKEYNFELFDASGVLKTSFNQMIPPPQPILSIEHIDVAGVDDEGVTHPAIKIEVPNNAAKNYFYVNIRLLEKKYDFEIEEIDDNRFEIFKIEDPILLNEGVPFPLFTNELMTRNSQEVFMNYQAGETNVNGVWVGENYPLVVELWTLNEAYYEFMKQNYQYENSRYPIIGSGNQTVISNFDNIDGAYGINAGYSYIKTDTIYPSGTENYFNQ